MSSHICASIENDEWRPVVGYEHNYAVSRTGEIKSTTWGREHIMRPWDSGPSRKLGGGYLMVRLWRGGDGTSITIHRIVAAAFIGPPNGLTVNHKNGDKKDNSVSNLEYLTIGDNLRHARAVLKVGLGVDHGMAKLSEDDVRSIRAADNHWGSCVTIALRFGISPVTVSRIRRRVSWKHID